MRYYDEGDVQELHCRSVSKQALHDPNRSSQEMHRSPQTNQTFQEYMLVLVIVGPNRYCRSLKGSTGLQDVILASFGSVGKFRTQQQERAAPLHEHVTLRIQVPNNHILAQDLYCDY